MSIILASKSPRRKELLSMLGVKFDICVSNEDESINPELTYEELVKDIALKKVLAVKRSANISDDLIIGADTIVVCNGEIFGKPKDQNDARRMLTALSGNRHEVYSGIAAIYKGNTACDAERTEVFFRTLSNKEIDSYIKTGEPMDKAGAYGIQGLGSVFIRRIEGDFFNVMGLPLCKLTEMIKNEFGVTLY
ncbi:MAG: Maf family protein [Bacillota bacterium]|nr:Maf family protein [Bacillota bacterium]